MGNGLKGGPLRDATGTNRHIFLHFGQPLDKMRLTNHIAHSPSGHAKCLGERIEHNQVFCRVESRYGMEGLVINQGRIDLIGKDIQAFFLGQIGNFLQQFNGINSSGGIVGRIYDNYPRPMVDKRPYIRQVRKKALRKCFRHNRLRPTQQHVVRALRPSRADDNYLVTGIQEHPEGQVNRLRCANGDRHILCLNIHARLLGLVSGDGFPKLQDAGARRIASPVLPDTLIRRLANSVRSRNIRVSQRKIYDVVILLRQCEKFPSQSSADIPGQIGKYHNCKI